MCRLTMAGEYDEDLEAVAVAATTRLSSSTGRGNLQARSMRRGEVSDLRYPHSLRKSGQQRWCAHRQMPEVCVRSPRLRAERMWELVVGADSLHSNYQATDHAVRLKSAIVQLTCTLSA